MLTTALAGKNYNYRGVLMAGSLAGARDNIYIENVFFSDPLISRMLIEEGQGIPGSSGLQVGQNETYSEDASGA